MSATGKRRFNQLIYSYLATTSKFSWNQFEPRNSSSSRIFWTDLVLTKDSFHVQDPNAAFGESKLFSGVSQARINSRHLRTFPIINRNMFWIYSSCVPSEWCVTCARTFTGGHVAPASTSSSNPWPPPRPKIANFNATSPLLRNNWRICITLKCPDVRDARGLLMILAAFGVRLKFKFWYVIRLGCLRGMQMAVPGECQAGVRGTRSRENPASWKMFMRLTWCDVKLTSSTDFVVPDVNRKYFVFVDVKFTFQSNTLYLQSWKL